MMEAADQGRLDDPALIDALHCSELRCVLLQRGSGSVTVVVGEVVSQPERRRWVSFSTTI